MFLSVSAEKRYDSLIFLSFRLIFANKILWMRFELQDNEYTFILYSLITFLITVKKSEQFWLLSSLDSPLVYEMTSEVCFRFNQESWKAMAVSCVLEDKVSFEPLSGVTSIFFDDKSFQVSSYFHLILHRFQTQPKVHSCLWFDIFALKHLPV